MFLLAKVQDEVVADKDGTKGFEEKALEPSVSLAGHCIRGATQADLRRGSSAAMEVIWWGRHHQHWCSGSLLLLFSIISATGWVKHAFHPYTSLMF